MAVFVSFCQFLSVILGVFLHDLQWRIVALELFLQICLINASYNGFWNGKQH
jgi:hypothetical protein